MTNERRDGDRRAWVVRYRFVGSLLVLTLGTWPDRESAARKAEEWAVVVGEAWPEEVWA